MYYAQIDPDSKLVIGIHDMSEYNGPNYIRVDSFDASLFGKVYDEENKTFINNPNPSKEVTLEEASTEPQPSETELSIMEAIADNYEATQEVKQGNLDIMSAIADMYESNDSSNSNTATS